MGEGLKPCPFCGSEARLLRGGTEVVCSSDGETGCNAVYFAVSDWNRRPAEDALRTRAEAAEARAIAAEAQAAIARGALLLAEADARLMLIMLVDLDVSEGTNVVRHWQDLGLTDAERDVLWSRFARTPPGVEEWEIDAVRRILAAAGGT